MQIILDIPFDMEMELNQRIGMSLNNPEQFTLKAIEYYLLELRRQEDIEIAHERTFHNIK